MIEKEIKQQIRLHWERGLRLLKEDSKEKEMQTLFLEYAKTAALNAEIVHGGLGSPQAKLKESFVGQQELKNELFDPLIKDKTNSEKIFLEVQEIPSEDVRIFPSAPTVTYLLFPYVIPKR